MLSKKYIAAALLISMLSGCQYASFFRTNTEEYLQEGRNNSDETCMAMGVMKGDATYDWCIEAEEKAKGHEMRYFPVPPEYADEYL